MQSKKHITIEFTNSVVLFMLEFVIFKNTLDQLLFTNLLRLFHKTL